MLLLKKGFLFRRRNVSYFWKGWPPMIHQSKPSSISTYKIVSPKHEFSLPLWVENVSSSALARMTLTPQYLKKLTLIFLRVQSEITQGLRCLNWKMITLSRKDSSFKKDTIPLFKTFLNLWMLFTKLSFVLLNLLIVRLFSTMESRFRFQSKQK